MEQRKEKKLRINLEILLLVRDIEYDVKGREWS